MGYRVGDRVRLTRPYGGMEFDEKRHADLRDTWVFPGDEGTAVGLRGDHLVRVKFDGKDQLLCFHGEIEPVTEES